LAEAVSVRCNINPAGDGPISSVIEEIVKVEIVVTDGAQFEQKDATCRSHRRSSSYRNNRLKGIPGSDYSSDGCCLILLLLYF
jgi:hypothetical protein